MYGVHVDVFTDHKSPICFYLKTVEPPAKEVVRVVERLRYECSVSPRQANVVADALSHMTMGSVSHIDEAKRDLVRDVHRFSRLGVRLESSLDRGFHRSS